MKRPSRDEEREQRITMEIIIDAYTPKSRPWGATTPSKTGCASRSWPGASPHAASRHCASVTRSRSSGCPGRGVRTRDVRPDPLGRRGPAVPLAQLEGVAMDEQVRQTIEDWHHIGSVRGTSCEHADLDGKTACRLATPLLGSRAYRRTPN
jgi:hypothetical protein